MKRLTTILIAIIAAVAPALAAEPTAQQVVGNCAKRLANAKAVTATFTSYDGDEDVSGTLTISGKMFSMVSSDFGVWYDGTDLCSYFKASGEATISVPTSDELMEVNPFDIISQYDKLFNVKMIEKKQRNYSILLSARNAQSSIKSAMLIVNGTTWLPTQIIATLSNDEVLNISIADVKVSDSPLPSASFRFPSSKYPGVEIVDIR